MMMCRSALRRHLVFRRFGLIGAIDGVVDQEQERRRRHRQRHGDRKQIRKSLVNHSGNAPAPNNTKANSPP